jgi:cell division septum initiation protein DivIVA
MDQFQLLEEKLTKVVENYRRTQVENRGLLQEIEKLKADSRQGAQQHDALEREVQLLRREREDVRTRVERLLQQIEVLTKQDSAG